MKSQNSRRTKSTSSSAGHPAKVSHKQGGGEDRPVLLRPDIAKIMRTVYRVTDVIWPRRASAEKMPQRNDVKSDWTVGAEEFREPLAIPPEQAKECFRWCEAHRYTDDKAPQAEEIVKMMDAADDEGAPQHVRHFLWAVLHFPEHIISPGDSTFGVLDRSTAMMLGRVK